MGGVLLCSRARWTAESNKVTKCFCELETRSYVSKQHIKLTFNNGEEIHEVNDIIKECIVIY